MKNAILALLLILPFCSPTAAEAPRRPNILWITSEDNGPEIGAYGDKYAVTPNIDRIAARGMIYLNAWSTAPVCAPARTTIISGVYPPSLGAEHMRCMTRLPAFMKMYPQYLREAGYYCTNNSKKDYNLEEPGDVWDASNRKAHWRGRQPGQPFFAVFNITTSHESQIRRRPHTLVHDPAKAPLPAYHPDTPEVRHDWAQYYDKVTEMDVQVGRVLDQLKKDGLADETIVFYYGDHGSGMPRSKRWPYNSGLSVPMVVAVPERFRDLAPREYAQGGKSDRLVGFIDLAPTVLSVAGIEPPNYMQGHAFMGKHETAEQPYNYGFRGRMDERYDMLRTVRDKRYVFIRNYMPHKIYGQYIAYMFKTPTTQVWKDMYDRGELSPPKTFFWETKPAEELYDLQSDPDEVNNLAGSPEHQEVLQRLRQAQRDWVVRIRDVGFLPEDEIHTRSAGSTPYEMGHNRRLYPLEKIMAAAELASRPGKDDSGKLVALFDDKDSAVRYWAALGAVMRGADCLKVAWPALRRALADSSPSVRVTAAEALGRYGNDADLAAALPVLLDAANLQTNSVYVSMLALNALDSLDAKAASVKETIAALPSKTATVPRRIGHYVPNLLKKILADLE